MRWQPDLLGCWLSWMNQDVSASAGNPYLQLGDAAIALSSEICIDGQHIMRICWPECVHVPQRTNLRCRLLVCRVRHAKPWGFSPHMPRPTLSHQEARKKLPPLPLDKLPSPDGRPPRSPSEIYPTTANAAAGAPTRTQFKQGRPFRTGGAGIGALSPTIARNAPYAGKKRRSAPQLGM